MTPYADFRADFAAGLEHWDAVDWARLFRRARARYVVLVTKHHDGFCLWPSRVANPHRLGWTTERDLVGELAEAVGAGGAADHVAEAIRQTSRKLYSSRGRIIGRRLAREKPTSGLKSWRLALHARVGRRDRNDDSDGQDSDRDAPEGYEGHHLGHPLTAIAGPHHERRGEDAGIR